MPDSSPTDEGWPVRRRNKEWICERVVRWQQKTKLNRKSTRFMKTKSNLIYRFGLGSGVAVALAFAVWAPGSAGAADPVKGGERQLNLLGITTKAEAEALKPGDTIAMVCTKCKSVMVHNVTTEKGHKVMTVGEKHLCPGCNTTIETVGVGKAGKLEVKHVCKTCGDDSIFCCATKPGSGATKGMDKK
jgi:hypothetical protein